MEVDKILYIFGSFSRKKDKRKSVVEQSSISAGNSPLRIPRNRPLSSQNLNVAPRTSAYDDAKKIKEWECGICKKELVEPRLLGCLHSFCTRCLQGLHQEGEGEVWSEVDGGSIQLDPGESGSGSANSAGSGYESDLRHSGSEGSWEQKHKYGIFTRKISGKSVQFLLCPTCSHETPLPLGGISALPLNYILLRKMMAVRREEEANVLCDLCNCDNKAESRCNQCLVSVCTSCGEAHGRQKATSRHSLKPLDKLPAKFCSQHPKAELSVYCATCQQPNPHKRDATCGVLILDVDPFVPLSESPGRTPTSVAYLEVFKQTSDPGWPKQRKHVVQVVCRDCCLISHSGHALANASRAAAERARLLRDACERAKHVPENVERAARNLNVQAMEVDTQAARVETEVQTWAEQYRRAVEAHGRALCTAAARARSRYHHKVDDQNKELEDRAQQARDAVRFAEELLSEAKEDELLSLSGSVLRRLERLTELQSLAEPPRCEMRFAPNAPVGTDSTLFGRLLTRAPDSERCVLNTEGLQDLRVDSPHEAIFELRDNNGERIWCGGEQVTGYFRRRDSSARPALARVTDRTDGSYSIVVTAPSPGAYLLAVTLNNKPIKGSPFPCAARVSKAHTGQFHCCAFCSSGGRRDATCGCGASMGGGYKGCGHGHAGWPGGRHWSCCGSTLRHGGCARAHKTRSQLYQFSL